jgi:hypothetical protein
LIFALGRASVDARQFVGDGSHLMTPKSTSVDALALRQRSVHRWLCMDQGVKRYADLKEA